MNNVGRSLPWQSLVTLILISIDVFVLYIWMCLYQSRLKKITPSVVSSSCYFLIHCFHCMGHEPTESIMILVHFTNTVKFSFLCASLLTFFVRWDQVQQRVFPSLYFYYYGYGYIWCSLFLLYCSTMLLRWLLLENNSTGTTKLTLL
jgi:hypothetical protein